MIKKLASALILLVLSIPIFGQIAETDFSKSAILDGKSEIIDWWQSVGGLGDAGSVGLQAPSKPVVVQDGVFTVPFSAGDYGGQGFRRTGLTIWKPMLPVTQVKKIYSEFEVKFSENFSWGVKDQPYRGGKFGLSWEVGNTDANKRPNKYNFQVTTMWRGGGAMDAYLYLSTNESSKAPDRRIYTYIQPGKWYKFATEIILNDPGKSNGSVRIYIDNKVAYELDNYELYNKAVADFKPSFGNFFGGSGKGWASETNCNIQYRYIKVWKSREEALGGTEPDPTPDPDPNPDPSPNDIVIAMLKEEIKRLNEELEDVKVDRDGLQEKINAIGLIIN